MSVVGHLVVGHLADDMAVLTSKSLEVLQIPRGLLPADAELGSVLTLTIQRDIAAEAARDAAIRDLQNGLQQKLGLLSKVPGATERPPPCTE
eukprot:CAMPEP_0183337170 /NCGR_PEP_ID=MMETSP0164_2-20130417/4926_1 /TAXON_ID=221442 /ORGANISM="Coccolithus pelagicus ssp braarudi, Strain PLY182g" /LENGTH=91 /DNA_ID=CAMNT_0025506827 /DNA_START=13 /DNA_END=288 /DNA_ORIENTATION=+